MEAGHLVLDSETTIKNKGSVFTKSNKLCLVGIEDINGYTEYDIEYSGQPYGQQLEELKNRIEKARLIIAFAAKFDLHWIRRYIPDVKFPRVFDCQLAEFILNNQTQAYPSLDGSCTAHGLGSKHDVVRLEYWDNGIDTTEVPRDILSSYLRRDVDLTRTLFEKQRGLFTPKQRRLFALQCEDLLILEEMEWNGMLYDRKQARKLGRDTQEKLLELDGDLYRTIGSTDCDLSSSDNLSSVLYGGYISIPYRETVTRTLKDGTIKERERWAYRNQTFPQLVKPLRGSEVKPTSELGDEELRRVNIERLVGGKRPFARHYSVAENILRGLNAKGKAKKIIDLLLERSKLGKLDSTYYTGLINKYDEQEWETDLLHGSLNQCVARTGRLSSSGPNLQNFSGEIKELFYSRYGTK